MTQIQMTQIQQGDVLIETATLPAGATRRPACVRGYVLAEGEATGHAHAIEATSDVELHEHEGTLYLRVLGEAATITHEEHRAVTVPTGTYRVGIVQEWDYLAQMARRVAD